MRIILCVTNDIITDQRVNRIGGSLHSLPAEIYVAGIRRPDTPELTTGTEKYKRFRLLFRKGPFFYAEYNVRLFFWLLFQRTNAVVANDLDSLPASFLASRIKGIPLIYDSHEYFTELPELAHRKHTRRIWESIERFLLPKIRYSYTVSASIAEGYRKKYGIRMEVIRNLPRRILSGCEESENSIPKIIIYQGSLNMGRGLENAIRAMQFINNARLDIAGSGYLESDLRNLVSSLKLQGKVRFLGRLLPESLYQYTCKAHLGISLEENIGLNYYYALPNKLFDYIQAQIPVLVSDLPEMASIVYKYGVGKTIHSANPEDLSSVMQQMLTDSSLRKVWKKNLITASGELCWENEEFRLLDIYRQALFQVPLSEKEVNEPDEKRGVSQHNQNIL